MQMEHLSRNLFIINSFIHSLSLQTIESLNVSSVTHAMIVMHSFTQPAACLFSPHSSTLQVALHRGSPGLRLLLMRASLSGQVAHTHLYANEAFPGCCGWSWSNIRHRSSQYNQINAVMNKVKESEYKAFVTVATKIGSYILKGTVSHFKVSLLHLPTNWCILINFECVH